MSIQYLSSLNTTLPSALSLASPQCRLRRIQTALRPIPPIPIVPPQPTISPPPSSAAAIHTNPDPQSSAADSDADPQSDPSPFLSASVITQQPAYPFPPPGLSKPSAATATSAPPDMITPDLEASSCTPRELELKSDVLASTTTTTTTTTAHSPDSDASIWSTFQMESFLGNYCHTTNKPLPSPPFHGDNEDGNLPPASIIPSPIPRPSPPALSPSHWNRLLKGTVSADDTALTTLNATTHPTTNTTTQTPPSILSPHPHRTPFSPRTQVNPYMAHRQRQQAFMTHWNGFRERNRYAPVMPSFFNPVRSEAPGCAWNFLRDRECGGVVNDRRASVRKGKESVFEKALVKLPLMRCRSICDRVRRDQQNYFGWGIHAWIGPSKHCRYCTSDELSKGYLAYRAFEFERMEELRRRQKQEESMLLLNLSTVYATSPDRSQETECDGEDAGAVFLSFPYRQQQQQQQQQQHHYHHHHEAESENSNQSVPTDPWINYNDLDNADTTTLPAKTPNDAGAWSEELEKKLLASPVIRDLDEFDLEDLDDFDDEGLYDDEDEEDGYSSSGSSSDISESDEEPPSSDDGGHIVGVDTVVKEDVEKEKKGKVCGKVLMSFWENDGDDHVVVDCVEVEVQVEAVEVVGDKEEEDDGWVKDIRVVEVQVQA